MIMVLMVMILAMPVRAMESNNQYASTCDTGSRITLLNKCAYITFTDKPSPELNYSAEIEQKYINMSDGDFQKAIETQLLNVVNRQKNGEMIKWNNEFISELQGYYPDLANTIQNKINKTPNGDESNLRASYTPGSDSHTFMEYGNNSLGIHLFALCCDVDWSWNTTQITSVLPGTYGETYAPLWDYYGIVRNTEGFSFNNTVWSKEVSGRFKATFNENVIENRVIELLVDIFAGGGHN
jgi:hypothetical protein